MYSVTAPNGVRSDYPHPLAPGELPHPVRDVQGCDFTSATRLLCAADDPGTDLWPTPKQLSQVDLPRPLDGRAITGHVTSLGELPMQSLCSGTVEVEGIDVSGSQLLVEVTPPSPCNIAATTATPSADPLIRWALARTVGP